MSAVLTGAPLYLAHFRLAEAPFSTTPDQRFLYLSERHREGFAHLLYGVAERGGFVQLTGEVGTGKTTLCRYLLEHLPDNVDVALILNPTVNRLELLATICDELRIPYPAGTESPKVLVDALYAHMLVAYARGRRTVVIVDEAQHLSFEVLEQMRLLTNFETATAKLLQIILVGQPELIERLSHTEVRQVAQRVTARYDLTPLDERNTHAYVLHRLAMAGQSATVFDEAALRAVHHATSGIPRRINILCDRALLGAYAGRRRRVTAAIVKRAAREVAGKKFLAARERRRRRIAIAAAAIGLTLAVASALASTMPTRWKRTVGVPASSGVAVAAIAAPTPAPAAPAVRRASLKALLEEPGLTTDVDAAYGTIAARWGTSYERRRDEMPCNAVRRSGLECLIRRGPWSLVRQFDLPAVLETASASGVAQFLAVTALDKDEAIVDVGSRREIVATDALEREWKGTFVVLWKPPRAGTGLLRPGTRGADVVWLRQRLNALDGQADPAARGAPVYDEPLAARVAAFQRAQKLIPDRIVGAETMAKLSAAADRAAPSLARARSGS
jgi:general secretion pathway protein A